MKRTDWPPIRSQREPQIFFVTKQGKCDDLRREYLERKRKLLQSTSSKSVSVWLAPHKAFAEPTAEKKHLEVGP